MPAPRKADAEAGTVEEAAATGNIDASVIADLAATQKLVLEQEALIQRLADQVAHLAKTAESDPPPDVPADFGPPPVPEGHVRFASRFSELTLMRVNKATKLVEGIPVEVPVLGKPVDFHGGVYETADASEIEWMESHPDFNIAFWVDEFAIKRFSTVEVQSGVKSTITTPRVPLAAPMQ